MTNTDISLQDFVMQEASRWFHRRGMEPKINMKDGQIEFEMPEGWTEEESPGA